MGGGLWEVCVVLVIVGSKGMLLGTHLPTVDACKPTNCWDEGPEIRFPFRRKGDPSHCGYHGFELSCQGNATMVELPATRQSLPVISISYVEQRLHLDPRSYTLAVLLNLSLSGTPFYYYPSRYPSYMLLNCTSDMPIKFWEGYHHPRYSSVSEYYYPMKCLNGHGHNVFAVQTNLMSRLDKSCIDGTSWNSN